MIVNMYTVYSQICYAPKPTKNIKKLIQLAKSYKNKTLVKKSQKRQRNRHRKSKNWLGPNYKSCIFVPSTPGSDLQRRMQKAELNMRPGGREKWAIKVIETAGKSIERVLVKTDPLNGNKFHSSILASLNFNKNKILSPGMENNHTLKCCSGNFPA